jgi:hypothetical protein
MPTLTETLTETNARLEALLGTGGEKPADEKLPADEVLALIAAEVKAGNVTKARAEYHQQVLATLAKNNFEATEFAKLKELNDPTQIKPKTETISLVQTKPQTHFASNLSTAMKAELIKRLIGEPAIITKGEYKDKLDDLQGFFGLSDKDMEDSYEISWKVGDLVRALQQAVKLENFVAKSTEKGDDGTEKSVKSLLGDGVWPADMAGAEFDPVAKAYTRKPSAWGSDSSK